MATAQCVITDRQPLLANPRQPTVKWSISCRRVLRWPTACCSALYTHSVSSRLGTGGAKYYSCDYKQNKAASSFRYTTADKIPIDSTK